MHSTLVRKHLPIRDETSLLCQILQLLPASAPSTLIFPLVHQPTFPWSPPAAPASEASLTVSESPDCGLQTAEFPPESLWFQADKQIKLIVGLWRSLTTSSLSLTEEAPAAPSQALAPTRPLQRGGRSLDNWVRWVNEAERGAGVTQLYPQTI